MESRESYITVLYDSLVESIVFGEFLGENGAVLLVTQYGIG